MQLRRSCEYLYTELYGCLRTFDSVLYRQPGVFEEVSMPSFTSGRASTRICTRSMQLIISHCLQFKWILKRRPMEAYRQGRRSVHSDYSFYLKAGLGSACAASSLLYVYTSFHALTASYT